MSDSRVFQMSFSRIYPLYADKVEKKELRVAELDTVIC